MWNLVRGESPSRIGECDTDSLGGMGALLVLALSLFLPVPVQGQEERSPRITGFHLQASNGYELLALAGEAPPEGDEGWIGLFLVRGDQRAEVTYAAPATVTRRSIDADLGDLGRISVTRVSTERTRTVRWGCKPGKTKQVEAGRYEGTIEFHGEEGFTDVSAVSAPLDPNPCGVGDEGGRPPGRSLPGARLAAWSGPSGQELDFNAIQNRPGTRTRVSAGVEEHRDGIEIHRATGVWASTDALRFDRRLRTATVRPPAPFSGYGSFRLSARGRNVWTGNLTVDLPGRPDVPLTGPGFWADLAHPRR